MKKYWLSLLILVLLTFPFLIPMGQAGATPIATGVAGDALSAPDAPAAPDSCSPPVTQSLRGKDVDLNQCYQLDFSYRGTNYTVDVYYTETDTATNLGRFCSANRSFAPIIFSTIDICWGMLISCFPLIFFVTLV